MELKSCLKKYPGTIAIFRRKKTRFNQSVRILTFAKKSLVSARHRKSFTYIKGSIPFERLPSKNFEFRNFLRDSDACMGRQTKRKRCLARGRCSQKIEIQR